MTRHPSAGLAARAFVSGTIGALASAAALAVLSRRQGHAAAQPINATSHWLHGQRAADWRGLSARHTGIGFLTHHASAVLWALLFERLRHRFARSSPDLLLTAQSAAVTSAVAAAVDYGLVPKRLTPGWELVLPPSSIAVGFVALAAGLTLGGLLADKLR